MGLWAIQRRVQESVMAARTLALGVSYLEAKPLVFGLSQKSAQPECLERERKLRKAKPFAAIAIAIGLAGRSVVGRKDAAASNISP
jgi:hypothetical protein